VGAALAEIPGEAALHLIERRLRSLVEERLRLHDHSVGAVTTLRSLFRDEGGLHDVGLLGRTQSFQCCDGAACGLTDWGDAGAHGFAVQQDGAGSALRQATAEFGAVEAELIS